MKIVIYLVLLFITNQVAFCQRTLVIDDYAPDIILNDTEGKVIKLSENLGSLTIVHFWASWSMACQPMNQFLAQGYAKYNKEGLEIFSVSIDKDASTWLEEIDKQELNWPYHVSDFKGMVYSKPAKDYKIYQVPSIFLIDENGFIIMINPSQEELSKRLKSFATGLKVLPDKSSNLIYLTKRSDYLIYDSHDTLVMGGKGKAVTISSLDPDKYRLEADGETFFFIKVKQEEVYDFQINYKTKEIIFFTSCPYEIRSKNGNVLIKGEGDFVDYSVLHLSNKDDFYLIVPNSAHSVKLY